MKSLRVLSPAGFLVLPLLAACFTAGTASGRDSKGRLSSWENLKSLTPGQDIRVVTNDFRFYQGEFRSLSDDGLTFRQKARERTLVRRDILRVSGKIRQSRQGQMAVLGAIVGAVAGFWIGRAIDRPNRNCTEGPAFGCSGPANAHWRVALTILGGLGGAGVGAGVTKGAWSDVYRAQ